MRFFTYELLMRFWNSFVNSQKFFILITVLCKGQISTTKLQTIRICTIKHVSPCCKILMILIFFLNFVTDEYVINNFCCHVIIVMHVLLGCYNSSSWFVQMLHVLTMIVTLKHVFTLKNILNFLPILTIKWQSNITATHYWTQ